MALLNEEKLGWQDKLDKFDSMQHELHAAERQFDAWTNVKNLSRAKKLGTASRGEEESKNRREEDWMLLSQLICRTIIIVYQVLYRHFQLRASDGISANLQNMAVDFTHTVTQPATKRAHCGQIYHDDIWTCSLLSTTTPLPR